MKNYLLLGLLSFVCSFNSFGQSLCPTMDSVYKMALANDVTGLKVALSADPNCSRPEILNYKNVESVSYGGYGWTIETDAITAAISVGNGASGRKPYLEIVQILLAQPNLKVQKLLGRKPILKAILDEHFLKGMSPNSAYLEAFIQLTKHFSASEGQKSFLSSPELLDAYLTAVTYGDLPILRHLFSLEGFDASIGHPDLPPLRALAVSLGQSTALARLMVDRPEISSTLLLSAIPDLDYFACVRPNTIRSVIDAFIDSGKLESGAIATLQKIKNKACLIP